MTFDDWAESLNLRANTFEYFPPAPDVRKAWRCTGPCGQLMYGLVRLKNWNYPSAIVPAGFYLSEDYPRVCNVCWEMYSSISERSYWVAARATDKKKYHKLKNEGDYLA